MTRPAWGNPWRGLIQAGEIQLPGGSTKSAPQPSGVHARHYDEQGATFLQRGPQAGVTRTGPELAADSAAGRTWRDDAILGGQRMDLYGKTLDGWVYCAPDGGRWLVPRTDIELPIKTNKLLSLPITLRRFGDFGLPAEERLVGAFLGSLGQAEPDPANPAGTDAYIAVIDITEDGRKALLMIYQPIVPFSASSGWHPLHKRPLGWLELTLAGSAEGIFATLTVVRTRTQTFGSGVWNGITHAEAIRYPRYEVTRVDKGTYYEDTYTQLPAALTGTGGSIKWFETADTYEYSFAGRILALWYTAAGALEEVTLEVSTTGTVSNPEPAEIISGSRVLHVQKVGGATEVVSDDRVYDYTRTSTVEEVFTVTLKRGGAVIDQSTGTASISLTQTWHVTLLSGKALISDRSDSATIDGATASSSTSSESDGGPIPLGTLEPAWFVTLPPGNSPAHAGYRATDMLLLFPGGSLTIDPLRYSNKLLSLRRYRVAAGVETYKHGPAAFPGGVDPGETAATLTAVFGSYNPATDEVVRDQTQSVCWI